MATRKDSATSAPTYPDGYMGASTPAQAARALNMPGKAYRDVLRSQLGVWVSRGGVFDDDAKRKAFDIINARKAKRATVDATP